MLLNMAVRKGGIAMMSVNIKSGECSLRASGTVIQFGADDIKTSFQLPTPGGGIFDIDVIFIFKEDSRRDAGFTVVNPLESMNPVDIGNWAQHEFTLYNSSSPPGVSNGSPLMLGEYSGLKLYLNFMAEGRSADSQKILHYSFYTS
jgi:Domain of unknown function (DUF6864)